MATHWGTLSQQEMVDRITDRSDGRFEITHYFGGELGIDYGDHPTALSDRIIDLATVSTGHSGGILPWIGIFQRPLLCSWPDDFYTLADAVLPIMERELGKLRITPLAFYAIDPVSVWTVPEVADITDMGGIKIRAWDEASAKVGEALGATPVIMNFYDVYLALQRGVVDGGITGSAAVPAGSWDEFVKHGYLVGLPPNAYYVSYNDKAFHELPYEYQVILLEEAARMTELHHEKSWTEFGKVNAVIVEHGVTLHEVSEEDRRVIADKLKPLWQDWADDGGPIAQELLDLALETLGY